MEFEYEVFKEEFQLLLNFIILQELGHESFDQGLPEQEAAKIAAAKIAENQHHDRLWYRINATRGVSGGRKLIPRVLHSFQQVNFELYHCL